MKIKLLLIIFLLIFFQSNSYSDELSELKNECSEIGFKLGTEKHGSCVLKLLKKIKKQPVEPLTFNKPIYLSSKSVGNYLDECRQFHSDKRVNFVTQMECWITMMNEAGNLKLGYGWENSNNSYSKLLQSLVKFAKIAQKQVPLWNADVTAAMSDVEKFSLTISNNANALDAQKANSSFNMMMLGLSIMNNGIPSYSSNNNVNLGNVPGVLSGSSVSGLNRICYYNKGGSTAAKTIGRSQLCSLTD